MLAATIILFSAPAWQPLFDGKTLAGWKLRNGSASYAVEKGEVVGRTVAGSPNSFLCTDKLYGDFELEFEVKVDPALNSGVQIRSMSVPGYQDGRVHGYQVEIDPTERGFSGGLYDEARRGWLQDLSKNEKGREAFKNGNWNKYRVLAKGDRFETWVNGVKCVDYRDSMTKFGFIALQVHSHEKTGLEVRWKNVRIKDFGIPTLNPPKGGRWLLRSPGDEKNWMAEGKPDQPCPWTWVEGGLQSGGGTICTRETIGDTRMHVEFMTDDNGLQGQANGNSGVYFMQSYEIQVLNSAPRGPLDNECGAIYSIKAPDFAMAFRAYEWQSYDIEFTAPRWDGDKKLSSARITAWHNGTLIHKDVEIPRATTAGVAEKPGARPFRLQDHGNKVRYRNIWVAPLR